MSIVINGKKVASTKSLYVHAPSLLCKFARLTFTTGPFKFSKFDMIDLYEPGCCRKTAGLYVC